MAYCTQSDLLEQISEDDLIGLTDDAGDGEIDSSVIARAIADADAEIDAYLYQRYTTPLDPVPAIIRKLSADGALYHLHSRRSVGMPDIRKERYEAAMRVLRDIATGMISIGASSPSPSSDDGPEIAVSRDDRVFTTSRAGVSGSLDDY